MKTLKPIHIILIGSTLVSVLILLLLFIANYYRDEMTVGVVITIWICTFVFSYAIFYYLVKRFISDRLKILYNTIRKGKFTGIEKTNLNISNDIITEAEKNVNVWSEERNKEISKLREQEEFRREFLGNLAHELKTPIFAIQGYILTLLDGGLEDENVNRRFLERASNATDRMVSIIEDLDQITKLEADVIKMEIHSFDIVQLIQETIETLEIHAGEKRISLKFDKTYSPTYVDADRSKISQVLTNLINNSINYGKKYGTTQFRIYELDNVITIEVSDDGPGIEESQFPRLFERFYRVEKSRNRHEGGSGLGLSIVKHIIESHGENIYVRSTINVGSTFGFTLKKS
ncbi:MAG: ATP-binding protein [Crocinitomicaceae bacterium]